MSSKRGTYQAAGIFLCPGTGRPRHGGGAERVRTQVSTDREGSPGTPVADELAWDDREKKKDAVVGGL